MYESEIVVFPWNKNFETGIKNIDEQHKNLLLMVNKLANTLVYNDPIVISEVFDELAEYAIYHFTEEEQVWDEYFNQDEWNINHRCNHHSFIPDIQAIKERMSGNNWQQTIEDVLHFLIRWLALHILDDDKKMSLVVNVMQNEKDINKAKSLAEEIMKGSAGILVDTVLNMYYELSSHAIELIREKHKRLQAEQELLSLNKQLKRQAITDELSGLYNRRHFMDTIDSQIINAHQKQQTLSFVLVDIDYFKQINDTFGHLKGDHTIVEISKALRCIFSDQCNLLFRMGGEEFLAVFTHIQHAQVKELAESLRRKVSGMVVEDEYHDHVRSSVSIGVFTQQSSVMRDANYYLEQVDKLLYQAKHSGRNCVVDLVI